MRIYLMWSLKVSFEYILSCTAIASSSKLECPLSQLRSRITDFAEILTLPGEIGISESQQH